MISATNGWPRAVAFAVSAALVVGAAACGDSDSEGDGASGAGQTSAAAQGSDERELRAVIAKFGQAIGDADGESACSLMTKEAQTQFAGYASAGVGGCIEGFRTVMKSEVVEDLTPRVDDIRIDGGKAVVFSGPSDVKDPTTARFAKQEGAWKVALWFTN